MTDRILVPKIPFFGVLLDDGSHFGSEDSLFLGAYQQLIKVWHWLHNLAPIFEVCESFIAFQEGNDLFLFPQVGRSWDTLNVAIHGVLEENSTKSAISLERWGGDDA